MAYIAWTKGKEPTAPRVRIEDAVRRGQFRPEELGLRGRAGFIGRGTYNMVGREAGYRRTR